jgi:hypothetical protein
MEVAQVASGTRKYVYQGTRTSKTIKIRDKVAARDVLGTVRPREV